MASEDKSQPSPLSRKPLPPFSPEDEKKAQQELARLRRSKKRGFEGKTLWDWLQLLGVPIFLAFATIVFGFVQFYLADQQHVQDQKLADQQHVQDQKLAQQQHIADQNNALDQQHATTLQTYIDNIQDLLLNHNLLGSNSTSDVAILARARTLTALQGLDPGRKGRLVQFIWEAQLIGFQDEKHKLHNHIIDLGGADLSFANLSFANLSFANLTDALLTDADLSFADLSGANLSFANLYRAHLSFVDLGGADLYDANLSFANLYHSDLSFANFYSAHLSETDLTETDLSFADLSGANLYHANLYRATFTGADLTKAYLTRANLTEAQNLTQQQLDLVSSCKGATLPKGLICHNNF